MSSKTPNNQQIQFLGEQNGVSKRELKRKFTKLFHAEPAVQTAFLAIASYDGRKSYDVAICIDASNADEAMLAQQFGKVLSAMFGSHEHLDRVLATTEQVK